MINIILYHLQHPHHLGVYMMYTIYDPQIIDTSRGHA